MKIAITITLLFCLPGIAQSADWLAVTGGESSTVSVDIHSISQVGKYWKAWVKTDLDAPQETQNFPVKKYVSTKYLEYVDCRSKTGVVVQFLAYDSGGDVVEQSHAEFNPKNLREMVPDTIGEHVAGFICGVAERRTSGVKKKGK
ncbi:hypothetical protein HF313_14980 [Massilia atriviolacea]|uniref:Surface-adhesin protein E-like domain-containing protein n=1 Tax=Massilia atriviolacea TaxID=2495579 RepID=A0A430HR68_9BURK|nr:surface-adhesin E family protein [Massilia atriviolacea]RSZ60015.1 hypothetical protein EJB06_07500 [Massilia atriviolacea]